MEDTHTSDSDSTSTETPQTNREAKPAAETEPSSGSDSEEQDTDTEKDKAKDNQEDDDDEDDEVDDENSSSSSDEQSVVDTADNLPEQGSSIFGATRDKQTSVVPLTISFQNLFYSVKVSKGFMPQIKKCKNPFEKERKYILKDLHGAFQPGEVTAILGPSGAGKTTLLNLLAGRINGGKVEGDIRLNGIRRKKISDSKWKKICAYVMQDDIMHGQLSTRETLHFAACLRVPGSFSHWGRRGKRVRAVIEELGLESCAKTKIGTPDARGISGGQRKRVSIGMELITEPSILFLDEPTTGLDSATAYTLVLTLRKLAEAGRTVISTIHSPSSDMFFKFDKVMFMSRGHILYHGPTSSMVAFFSRLNFKCPKYANPCEYVMNLAKDDSHIDTKDAGKERVKELVTVFRNEQDLEKWDWEKEDSENRQAIMSQSGSPSGSRISRFKRKKHHDSDDEGDPSAQKSASLLDTNIRPQRSANIFVQFIVLTIRTFLITLREPMTTYVRLIQNIFLALLVGFLYLQIGDDQSSIQDREGSLFFVTIVVGMSPVLMTQAVFPLERAVFIREHSTGSYTTLAYFISKVLSEVPFQIFFPMLFSAICYWMVGYDAVAYKFFIFMACLIMLSFSCQALGLAMCAGVSNMHVAMALTPMIFIPLMLLGGLFLNNGSVPYYLIWAKYLSPMYYAFDILIQNEMQDKTFYCSGSEFTGNGTCPFTTGSQVISALSLNNTENQEWVCFILLFGLYLFYLLIALVLLKLTAGRKKGA